MGFTDAKEDALKNLRKHLEKEYPGKEWETQKEIAEIPKKDNLKDENGNLLNITRTDINRDLKNDKITGLKTINKNKKGKKTKYILKKTHEKRIAENKLEEKFNFISAFSDPSLFFISTDLGEAESLGHNFYKAYSEVKGYISQNKSLILVFEDSESLNTIMGEYNLYNE